MEANRIEVDIKVPNKTRYLSLIGKIGEDIARELERYSGDKETLAYHLNLVLTEAMVNAIKHAGVNEPEKLVRIVISLHADELTIRVYDDGQGFDINSIPPAQFRGTGGPGARDLPDPVAHGLRLLPQELPGEHAGDEEEAHLKPATPAPPACNSVSPWLHRAGTSES